MKTEETLNGAIERVKVLKLLCKKLDEEDDAYVPSEFEELITLLQKLRG